MPVLKLSIRSMVSNSGDSVEPAAPGVTCFVGANNVGKSQILRDLMANFENLGPSTVALREISGERPRPDENEDIEVWMRHRGVPQGAPGGGGQRYIAVMGGQSIPPGELLTWINSNSGSFYLGPAQQWFCWYASAGALIGLATGSLGASPGMTGNSPLARLFRDGDLEEELGDLALQAFGTSLTLDRTNADVRLRVGRVDGVAVPLVDHPTLEYSNAVAELPSLEQQGDGIKSFLGLALVLMAVDVDLVVVDEPEAFLHPAQSRTLGRWMAREAGKRGLQIMVATHDRDFVLGLVDSADDVSVTVVRVTRNGDETGLRQLTAGDLRTVWSDPVLRYSNVLQGLFYEAVCVCEGDADCRFYAAILDVLADELGARAFADNVMFVPSGGKQRIASLAKPLNSLGVKGIVIADFDVLRDRTMLRGIVDALGAAWSSEMERDYVILANAMNAGPRWPEAKTQGLAAVPHGAPNAAAARLLDALAEVRVLIVPVGELECFDRTIGLTGAAWVSSMLEANRHRTNDEARAIVRRILPGSVLAQSSGARVDSALPGEHSEESA